MYFRQFVEAPQHLIQNRKANFGTFAGVSSKLDIKGMLAPYAGVPVPPFMTNIRIKGRLNYLFSLDQFIGMVEFYDFKFLGLAEMIFWNKETGKKNVYHTIVGPRRHFIPLKTQQGICASYRKSRYIKVSWAKNHRRIALSFRLKGDDARPTSEGLFISPLKDDIHTDCSFVNPAPSSSRCTASWISTMSINGQLRINGEDKINDAKGLAMMVLNRAYYKFATFAVTCWGLGSVKEKNVMFQLKDSNLDAADPDKFNDNVLIVDGEETALPSVVFTYPFGINKKWIIQDTESMVDLTFTPVSVNSRILNLIAVRTAYNTIYGTFDGTLLNKNGDKIILKNFSGVLNRNFVRL